VRRRALTSLLAVLALALGACGQRENVSTGNNSGSEPDTTTPKTAPMTGRHGKNRPIAPGEKGGTSGTKTGSSDDGG
jgi:hypothetical protein